MLHNAPFFGLLTGVSLMEIAIPRITILVTAYDKYAIQAFDLNANGIALTEPVTADNAASIQIPHPAPAPAEGEKKEGGKEGAKEGGK